MPEGSAMKKRSSKSTLRIIQCANSRRQRAYATSARHWFSLFQHDPTHNSPQDLIGDPDAQAIQTHK
jgi:hypothetical protein